MSDTLVIACPNCHSKNRLPVSRLADGGHCGRCKQSLFQGRPLALSTRDFDAHAQSDLPLVVDFWAAWCGPCQQFAPIFQQAARKLEPRVQLAKVDTEAEPALASRFGIRSIPTLIMLQRGREIARLSGALPGDTFVQWVHQNLP